jgi:hypothetical protein
MIYPSEGGNLIFICKIPLWSDHEQDERRFCTAQQVGKKDDREKKTGKLRKTIKRRKRRKMMQGRRNKG